MTNKAFSQKFLQNIFTLALIFSSVFFAEAQTQKKISPARSPKNPASQTQTDTPELRRAIKIKADEVSNSMLTCEYDKMYDLMHPKVREMVGGRDAFFKMIGEGVRNLEAEGFTIISIENLEPDKIVSINQEMFAVVPTKLKIKTPQGNLIQSAYDMAVSNNNGQTWVFVGGSLGKAALEKLFPQIIGKLIFPEPTLPVPEQ